MSDIDIINKHYKNQIIHRRFVNNNKTYYLLFDRDYKSMNTDFSIIVSVEKDKVIQKPFSAFGNIFNVLQNSEIITPIENWRLK